MDRVVITTQPDIAELDHSLKRKESGIKAGENYAKAIKQAGLNLDDYFGRMIKKEGKGGMEDYNEYMGRLPGHTKMEEYRGITVKALEGLQALKKQVFDTITGKIL